MARKLTFDLSWLIVAILVVALAVVTYLWKPWTSHARTIEVIGKGIVTQLPDEYAFSPYIDRDGDTNQAAVAAVSTEGQAMVAKLKELGVADTRITSSITSNSKYSQSGEETNKYTATFSISATATDKAVADKVQDYLTTAGSQGSISPYASFSTTLQNTIEKTARDKAIIDAKEKANQTASAYNAKIGKVKTVSDEDSGQSAPWQSYSGGGFSGSSYPVTQGETDYVKLVKVVYELK